MGFFSIMHQINAYTEATFFGNWTFKTWTRFEGSVSKKVVFEESGVKSFVDLFFLNPRVIRRFYGLVLANRVPAVTVLYRFSPLTSWGGQRRRESKFQEEGNMIRGVAGAGQPGYAHSCTKQRLKRQCPIWSEGWRRLSSRIRPLLHKTALKGTVSNIGSEGWRVLGSLDTPTHAQNSA